MIGGNVTALLQVIDEGTFNAIGEREHTWSDVTALKGWIDLQTGESNRTEYDARIQKSTHIFLCDFRSMKNISTRWVWDPFNFLTGIVQLKKTSKWKWNPFSFISGNIRNSEESTMVDVTSENARMVVNGAVYDILMIDNPMGMNQHLEIYLRFVGGQDV